MVTTHEPGRRIHAINSTDTKPTLPDDWILVERDTGALFVRESGVWKPWPTLTRNKVDFGKPGDIVGLDVGEGGSYSKDETGTTIVKAFSYDASAASGSRFTELTITANNTLLGDAGDRIYVGSPNKFWAARFEIGVAKSSELYSLLYWNGSALTAAGYMGITSTGTDLTFAGDAVLESTGTKRYVALEETIDADWALADNQLDAIPNTGSSLYWVALQVPGGGFATPPRVDDIKVRGTDTDIITGNATLVNWGKARQRVHTSLPIDLVKIPAANPAVVSKAITSTLNLPVYEFRNAQTDTLEFMWTVPDGIDTSCKVKLYLGWWADATGDVEWDLVCKVLKNTTAIGSGESSDASWTATLTPSGADAYQTNSLLTTAGNEIDISATSPNDEVVISLARDGSSDANAGKAYAARVKIQYVLWTVGEHV